MAVSTMPEWPIELRSPGPAVALLMRFQAAGIRPLAAVGTFRRAEELRALVRCGLSRSLARAWIRDLMRGATPRPRTLHGR